MVCNTCYSTWERRNGNGTQGRRTGRCSEGGGKASQGGRGGSPNTASFSGPLGRETRASEGIGIGVLSASPASWDTPVSGTRCGTRSNGSSRYFGAADLLCRIARSKISQKDCNPYGAWLQLTTAAANFVAHPQQAQDNNQGAQGGAWAPPAPPPQAMATQKIVIGDFLVQGDKNEIPGIVLSDVRRWRGNWSRHSPGGREPDADIDPTNEQLAALNWRLVTGGAPYADFALWTPINNRLVHVRKFSTFRQTEVGTWEKVEVKGPGSLMQWRYYWRVFRTAAIMLDAISSGTLEAYERWVEKLAGEFVDQDGAIWGVLYK